MTEFNAYLDDYGIITVIMSKELYIGNDFYLKTPTSTVKLDVLSETLENNQYKIVLKYMIELVLVQRNYLIYHDQKTLLKSGRIVRTKRFDEEFKYEDLDLGITYTEEKTICKVWSPVIKDIEFIYFKEAKKKEKAKFTYYGKGIWYAELKGNFDEYYYYFNVKMTETYKKVMDPYAIAVNANGKYAMIVNPKNLYQIENKKTSFSGVPVDAIIYEAHVRDLSSLTNKKSKGKFMGLIEEPSPLDYIKDLGMTHLELLPIMDYYGVDELNTVAYNWGYNPESYFSLEGSYSNNPRDPKKRINELRMVVDYMHKIDLGLIVDVVYNHVYSEQTFPFNDLVPGYYYRYDERGIKTQFTYLDNDVASERNMTRQLILQATKHLIEFYDVDGFRFDLMGLLDIKTVNEVYELTKKLKPNAILIGEGWNMDAYIKSSERANMSNQDKMEVAHFNDVFRERFHNVFLSLQCDFTELLKGTPSIFSTPNKSVNYLSCHDGLTLYDRLTSSGSKLFLVDQIRLSFAFILLSEGIPFIQGGDEFLRSKRYNSNSYNSGDMINGFNYDLLQESKGIIKYIKDLISIRKEHDVFRQYDPNLIQTNVQEIHSGYYSFKNNDKMYYIYFKLDNHEEIKRFDDDVYMIFDGYKKVNELIKEISINHIGAYIFYKEIADGKKGE